MANRPHPRMARTDPSNPRGWGTCQRCGFVGNLHDFNWNYDWRGLKLVNTQTLVCLPCLDEPQRQIGSIVLPPDPESLNDARPEPYAIDEYWPRLLQGGYPRYLQGVQPGAQNPRVLQYLKYFE